jgi:hypothetical protein
MGSHVGSQVLALESAERPACKMADAPQFRKSTPSTTAGVELWLFDVR